MKPAAAAVSPQPASQAIARPAAVPSSGVPPEMISIWLLLAYVMADIIGRGHGGDGAGDPPPPGGDDFWRGHQGDVPQKKVRGKAKNFGLRKALTNNKGRPLEIPFDTEATNMPVGLLGNYFTRELGLHLWRSVPLDREGWKNVDKETKNAVYEHTKGSFDLDAVEKDLAKKGGVKAALQKRFKDRKNMAKQEFLNRGGYGDVARARASVPDDMTNANWQAAIDHFTSPEHIKRPLANQAVRQQQVYTNRGGTRSYANVCYNQDAERYDAYFKGHTDRAGNFDSPQSQANYNRLVEEFEAQHQRVEDGDGPSQVDPIGIFETVLGRRRGHVRGIGPRPYAPEDLTFQPQTQEQEQTPTPQIMQEQIVALMENPQYRDQLLKMVGSSSQTPSYFGNEHDGGDDDDEDDD